jgi:hypothetical protein
MQSSTAHDRTTHCREDREGPGARRGARSWCGLETSGLCHTDFHAAQWRLAGHTAASPSCPVTRRVGSVVGHGPRRLQSTARTAVAIHALALGVVRMRMVASHGWGAVVPASGFNTGLRPRRHLQREWSSPMRILSVKVPHGNDRARCRPRNVPPGVTTYTAVQGRLRSGRRTFVAALRCRRARTPGRAVTPVSPVRPSWRSTSTAEKLRKMARHLGADPHGQRRDR